MRSNGPRLPTPFATQYRASIGAALYAGEAPTRLDQDAARRRGVEEQMEKRRTVHAKSEALAGEPGIPHVEHDPPGRQRAAEERRSIRPPSATILPDRAKARGASITARPPVTGEEKRGSEPRRGRTGDRDRKRAHRAVPPCPAFPAWRSASATTGELPGLRRGNFAGLADCREKAREVAWSSARISTAFRRRPSA